MKQLSIFSMHDSYEPDLWTLRVDGASRGNPGPAGIGIVITRAEQVVMRDGFFIGHRTNNEAEYMALLIGLVAVTELMPAGDLLAIRSDSQLLVRQMTGHYKVRQQHLVGLYEQAQRLLRGIDWSIQHIVREQNSEADALANRGIDMHCPVPLRWHHIYTLLR